MLSFQPGTILFVGAVRYLPCAGAPVGEGGDDEAARILALRRRAGYAPNPQSGHGVHGVFARLPGTMAPRGAARALRRRPARVVRTWRRGATARRTLLRADVPRNSCPSRASSPFGGRQRPGAAALLEDSQRQRTIGGAGL